MFEKTRAIPRAVVDLDDDSGAERAARWTLNQAQSVGGQPLLYVPGKRNIDYNPVLLALSKRVTTATWRTLLRERWSGGPVLAAWPDQKHLADIDGDPRTSALCVLGWSQKDTQGWAAAYQPERLTPGAGNPPRAGISDPVVEQGMKTMTALVNHANQLAGSMDRRDAVNVLLTLHDGGHRFEPDELYAWALANGWPARGADRLKEFAMQINRGSRPRADRSALRPDILQVWRAEAGS